MCVDMLLAWCCREPRPIPASSRRLLKNKQKNVDIQISQNVHHLGAPRVPLWLSGPSAGAHASTADIATAPMKSKPLPHRGHHNRGVPRPRATADLGGSHVSSHQPHASGTTTLSPSHVPHTKPPRTKAAVKVRGTPATPAACRVACLWCVAATDRRYAGGSML